MPVLNASIATKWVAQMPPPVTTAAAPNQAGVTGGRLSSPRDQTERRIAGKEAYDGGKRDQSQIVLLDDAVIDSEHRRIMAIQRLRNGENGSYFRVLTRQAGN